MHNACLCLEEVSHFRALVHEILAEHLQTLEATQPRQKIVRCLLLCVIREDKHDVNVVWRPFVQSFAEFHAPFGLLSRDVEEVAISLHLSSDQRVDDLQQHLVVDLCSLNESVARVQLRLAASDLLHEPLVLVDAGLVMRLLRVSDLAHHLEV